MKKKLLLMLTVVAMLVCVFAISVSAAGSTSDAYGTITTVDGETEPTVIDSTARVVIVANDGTYYTFPAYYIISDSATFAWRKNDSVNQLLGYSFGASDIRGKIIRMELPEGITALNPNNNGGGTVFEDAKIMVEIKLPSTLTKIGDHTFNRCYKLATIDGLLEFLEKETTTTLGKQMVAETLWGEGVDLVIPKNVTSIPERCFYGTKIKSVTFHDNITHMGARAFQSCTNLTSVELPSSLEELSSHVFASCKNIESVDVSACTKLKKIGEFCFEYSAISSFDFTPFASGLISLGNGLFNGCTKLTSVTGYELADNITAIGEKMFNKCPLTELKFPNNITSIGNYAFFGHKSQQSVIRIPNGVTTIGDHAFVRDGNTKKIDGTVAIHLPASLTGFTGNYNFENWDYDVMYIPAGVSIVQGVTNGTLDKGVVYYYTGEKDSLTIHNTHNAALLNAEWISVNDFTGASSDKNYIVYGYNKCDAFYESSHLEDNNPCVINCTRCGANGVAEKNPVHNEEYTISYTSYDALGTKTYTCSNEGCKYVQTEHMPALFVCLGYSSPENGDASISIAFNTNATAMEEYTKATGKTLKYGVFAVSKDKLGENDVFGADGSLVTGAISFDVTDYEYSAFALKIVGFADNQKATKLAMGAYVAVTDGETTTYSYLQDDQKGERVDNYYFVSYNDVVAK